MTKLFSRWLPCATLLAWSAILLGFYCSGRIASFLHPTFRPFVLVTGILMFGIGACFLFLPGVASCCGEDQCGHPLGRMNAGRVLTFLVLLLPIGLAATVSPNQFGAATMANRGVVTDASGLVAAKPRSLTANNSISEPPLPTKDGSQSAAQTEQSVAASELMPRSKDGNVQVAVIDLLYAAQDPSLRADFENKTVELIGQLMPDDVSNASGHRFKVVRMFMVCCAADAKPVAALVESPQPPTAPEMSWVKVIGKATFPLENGRTIAVLKADRVIATDPPDETMLY